METYPARVRTNTNGRNGHLIILTSSIIVSMKTKKKNEIIIIDFECIKEIY